MTMSIDGKVTGDFLSRSECGDAVETYYRINREYAADAYVCGRVTMEGSFTGGVAPVLDRYKGVKITREDYVADAETGFYAVAFDTFGRLGWTDSKIEDEDPGYGGAHIIEVLSEAASDEYLAYLKDKKISYIFAGENKIDVITALEKLKRLFGIEKLLLEGGSLINGSFQRIGVVDELSLVVAPVISGADGRILFDEGVFESYKFEAANIDKNGVISVKYKK